MFCPNCGKEIQTEALFCGNCGFKVEDLNLNAKAAAEPAPAPTFEDIANSPIFQPSQPAVQPAPQQQYANANNFQPICQDSNQTLKTVIKVFMIIACVAQGWMIIPLAWCIPMTVSVCKSLKTGRPIGMGMKICTLLFVSLVSGICLLCLKDNEARR